MIDQVLRNERQWHVERSDVAECLKTLPDGCVHCCITSPPYFALRDYRTGSWAGGNPECDHLGEPKRNQAGFNERYKGKPNKNTDKQSEVREPCKLVCEKCGARRVDKQLGLEKTPSEYVARMVEVFREVRRVLHDSGVFVLNVGDSYSSGNDDTKTGFNARYYGADYAPAKQGADANQIRGRKQTPGIAPKNLLGVPWQLALALRDDGWILRNHMHWIKLSPMPSSSMDRLTVAHEDIFLFAKSPKYFWDSFAVRRPSASTTLARDQYTRITTGKDGDYAVQHDHETPSNPAGRQWRTSDVWLDGLDQTIAEVEDWLRHLKQIRSGQGLLADMDGEPLDLRIGTEPLHAGHYAAFPTALVRPFLRAGASEKGVCAKCGEPWRRVIDRESNGGWSAKYAAERNEWQLGSGGIRGKRCDGADNPAKVTAIGWQPGCSCEAETVPALVLDPFAGSGTVGVVCRQLGLRFLGIDLSAEYVELARERIVTALRQDELKTARAKDVATLFDGLD